MRLRPPLSLAIVDPVVDWFLPKRLREDRDNAQRARMFVLSHLAGPFLGHPITVFLMLIDPQPWPHVYVLGASISIFWLFPIALKLTGQYVALALLSVQNLIFATLWGCYHYGGVSSPFLPWLLMVPLLAFFYLGPNGRIRYAVFGLVGANMLMFYVAYAMDHSFPQHVPLTDLVDVGMVSIFGAAVYVSMMAVYYANVVASQSELQREVARHRATMARLRVAKEEAERANGAKSEFLAKMSHELRTPLNAVIGYSEMLLEDAELEGRGEEISDLQKINSAGKHLLSLVTDVLDLSKIEAGRMDLFIERFDANEFVDDVAATCRQLVTTNANELVVERDPDLGSIDADVTKLRQAALNLLSNAAKFTNHGKVTLEARRERQNGIDWLTIHVRDTGIGIGEGDKAKLFENFSQTAPLISSKFGGTGLGLSLSRKLCRLMGGDITVESRLGEGSCFSIRIPASSTPVIEDRPQSALDGDALPEQAAETAPRETVLVIDDDPAVLDMMERILLKEGLSPVLIDNATGGIRLAQTLNPSIIVLDVLLPDMDGWEALRTLRADPRLKACPVVMQSVVDERRKGLSMGAADYLVKPVDRDALVQAIARLKSQDLDGPVLVIGDCDHVLAGIERELAKDEVSVVWAADFPQGLALAAETPPACVVLGGGLPPESTLEFLAALGRTAEPRRTPMLALVGSEQQQAAYDRVAGIATIVSTSDREPAEIVHELRGLIAGGDPETASSHPNQQKQGKSRA